MASRGRGHPKRRHIGQSKGSQIVLSSETTPTAPKPQLLHRTRLTIKVPGSVPAGPPTTPSVSSDDGNRSNGGAQDDTNEAVGALLQLMRMPTSSSWRI
ncbi:hypothetical protein M422DRAFT_264275 [Sphaerobolus stellatus SS14]|uniref:Uncharacterized protein n=1 Tax=Sphaerobolus stellatus (strain SS14) TaxID=990650 RepID=A0A0C9UFS9_SPHS4|nr:hypothetical protein M422DRAFT_264275 [Sphaerobolus stellatus SS14]